MRARPPPSRAILGSDAEAPLKQLKQDFRDQDPDAILGSDAEAPLKQPGRARVRMFVPILGSDAEAPLKHRERRRRHRRSSRSSAAMPRPR